MNSEPGTSTPVEISTESEPARTENRKEPVLLGFVKSACRPGWVVEKGVKKQIVAYRKASRWGFQFLLKVEGSRGCSLYKLVAASTFGKALKSYMAMAEHQQLQSGNDKLLKDKLIENLAIGGVASVRRDLNNQPRHGWQREPVTFVITDFNGDPTKATWFTRTQLRNRFGLNAVDKEIYAFRKVARQKPPKGRPLKYNSDDEDSEDDDHNEEDKEEDMEEEEYEEKEEEQVEAESEASEESEESEAEGNNAEDAEPVRGLKVPSNQVRAFRAQKAMAKLQISLREKMVKVKEIPKTKKVSKLKMKGTRKVIKAGSERTNPSRG
ncbi:hypothetical protein LPUS_12029 [Lasallia pustulata]|uniref:Uncharacterized protein n=1 Tax=Lasallia pustulata TaxID=136370 RepID=A0A1W5DDR6_9LECA|nr:hypothetical protein LPUS_12029 [Lasallia pustulata]